MRCLLSVVITLLCVGLVTSTSPPILPSPPSVYLFTCDDRPDGTYPDPHDCTKFYECRNEKHRVAPVRMGYILTSEIIHTDVKSLNMPHVPVARSPVTGPVVTEIVALPVMIRIHLVPRSAALDVNVIKATCGMARNASRNTRVVTNQVVGKEDAQKTPTGTRVLPTVLVPVKTRGHLAPGCALRQPAPVTKATSGTTTSASQKASAQNNLGVRVFPSASMAPTTTQ
ncbi:PREDICTED: uncharacterized protein LOC109481810 [Branchiostoma belcheri]|uniref:chitinase n=1 Tax=Branchiostoma belcheri TaxID=7741 RepID=A0A6P4ZSX9_BRABE|nr:PREDICTED: uncharacterized protein LOC109481810 [Branchiostoma belcheri]